MKHKQNTDIYLITSIGNLDKTVDLDDESPTTFDTLDEAVEEAKKVTEEYGLVSYVYKCKPVIRINRGKIKVTKLV
jgi:DNA primase